ncbi:MAG: hypothetical protein GXP39_07070 [Chloroflexi bacterium]|nr:hypothetical protein [Chloroflexota bacterium]
MNVGQVIELAKEWVRDHGSQTPGFCGAHLMGALNHLPKNTPFPSYKDVDLNLVLKELQTSEPWEISYKGLILECGRVSVERYRSPEVVLSDPGLAPNLVTNSILSDPFGMLTELHAVVSREYPRRKWVLARYEAEKKRALQGLQGIERANSLVEILVNLYSLIGGITGTIAVADLKPPTHRRCLIVMREVLEAYGEVELEEEVLGLLGFAQLGRADVEGYLQECIEAFDRAVEVTRTPVPAGFKLHPYVRPYMVEGAREMINEGYHREAMYWILLFWAISNTAIQLDAPEGEKDYYQAKFGRFLSDIGWGTLHDAAIRRPQASKLANNIFNTAKEIIDRNPEIMD